MVYLTGDMHGDLERFKAKAVRRLRKNDTLIITGDFGFVWNGSPEEHKLLAWIGKRRFNTLFVEGTHDNLDLLKQYPVEEWNGGQVRTISGRLRYLMRGELYTIEQDRYFVMGGGESADSDARVRGLTWWDNELPDSRELEAAQARLDAVNWSVDFIVTHSCPASVATCIEGDRHARVNLLTAFLNRLQECCRYKGWFFGSYHVDKLVPPYYHALYSQLVPVRAKTK